MGVQYEVTMVTITNNVIERVVHPGQVMDTVDEIGVRFFNKFGKVGNTLSGIGQKAQDAVRSFGQNLHPGPDSDGIELEKFIKIAKHE